MILTPTILDTFEVWYSNNGGSREVRFGSLLEDTKELVRNLQEQNCINISISYYSTVMVRFVGQPAPGEQRLGEVRFTPAELLSASENIIQEAQERASAELDEYMLTIGCSPNVTCDEAGCSRQAIEHLHYDFPNHDFTQGVLPEGISVSFGGEKSGNFCATHITLKTDRSNIPSRLGICKDPKCVGN